MNLFRNIACVALLVAGLSATSVQFASADMLSLAEAYQHAREYDANLGSARADVAIAKEEVSKSAALFLPNLRSTASFGRNMTNSQESGKPLMTYYYNTRTQGLSVRQPVINFENIVSYRQARDVHKKSEMLLRNEEGSLISRTIEAYFNVLYGMDSVEFSSARLRAAAEQLQQSKRRYDAGYGTITEIHESQAGFDMAVADRANSLTALDFSRHELERLTGVYPGDVCLLDASKLALSVPDPADVEYWIESARRLNPKINAAERDVSVAKKGVKKERTARYPTIDLWAGRNYSLSENNYTIGSAYETYSVSVQMSVPIYTGGYISAEVRQAKARELKAMEQYSWQERAVVSDVRKTYNGVVNGVALVKAYEQALTSYEIALDGTKKGFASGFRSNVDVLNAEQELLDGRRNLARARYQYILNRIMLKESAGLLAEKDILEVNALLGKP
ncbi:MAG: TolC family outer membrane protein [Chlorobium phaeovibrioides]|nr:TolC family outer membrane protein [Chlorobium phaeovibrioides]